MNRRDFLDPRRLALQTAKALDQVELLPHVEPNRSADPVLLRFARQAMATTFEIILPFSTPQATAAAGAALDLIDQLEDQLTIYRPDSEVSRLNATAGQTPVEVERPLFDLLMLAKQLHQETGGAFDISAHALIKAWRFHVRAGSVPSSDEIAVALAQIGSQHMLLDATRRSVSFARPGLEINLGSIGKGYALDRAVQMLWKDWQIANVLIHGGQSSIFALGTEPGTQAGWSVTLSDPRDPRWQMGVFRLRDRALGTSSATYQHIVHEGRKLGHILDPRTGWPAEGMLGATATAPTAALADALATAFFILGTEPARAYCQDHPEIGVVLVPNVRHPRPIVLGRASEEFRLGD